jgi:hypothetical protein
LGSPMALSDIACGGPSPICEPKMPNRHVVKFWDTSRHTPGPIAIDFLAADSLPEALAQAATRLGTLKKKYGRRVGYRIEDAAGHIFRSW